MYTTVEVLLNLLSTDDNHQGSFNILAKINLELSDLFNDAYLQRFKRLCSSFQNNADDFEVLTKLIRYIKSNIETPELFEIFTSFLTSYLKVFTMQDTVEILHRLGDDGINFSQILSGEHSQKVRIAEQLIIFITEKSKTTNNHKKIVFLQLVMLNDNEKIDYLMTIFKLDKYQADIWLYKAKLLVKINCLNITGLISYEGLQGLKLLTINMDYRAGLFFYKDCLTAIEVLSDSDMVKNTQDIRDRDDFYSILSALIIQYWINPIVAQKIIFTLNRLYLYKNFLWDEEALLDQSDNFILNKKILYINNKQELLNIWFSTQKLLDLWDKVDSNIFTYVEYFALLFISHRHYTKQRKDFSDEIQQEVFDFINSAILCYKYKNNIAGLIKEVPSDMRYLYLINDFYGAFDFPEMSSLLYLLPNNIVSVKYGHDISISVHIEDKINIQTERLESLLSKLEGARELYNYKFLEDDLSFILNKFIYHLEKKGTPFTLLLCGLLLINGSSINPRNLEGNNFEEYNQKRLHDAITFLNQAAKSPDLRESIQKLKLVMMQEEQASSVRARLDAEINSKVSDNSFFLLRKMPQVLDYNPKAQANNTLKLSI